MALDLNSVIAAIKAKQNYGDPTTHNDVSGDSLNWNDDINELKGVIRGLHEDRKITSDDKYCSSYVYRDSNQDFIDNSNNSLQGISDLLELIPACSCNARSDEVITCDSRTADICSSRTASCPSRDTFESQCTVRTYVSACECDSRTIVGICECDSRTGSDLACECDQRVGNCECDSRVFGCDCDNRGTKEVCPSRIAVCVARTPTGVCYCDSRTVTPTCECDQRVGNCDCNSRTFGCDCDNRGTKEVCPSRIGIFCDCDSRTADVCSSRIAETAFSCVCDSRTACECNARTSTCDSRTACDCDSHCTCDVKAVY